MSKWLTLVILGAGAYFGALFLDGFQSITTHAAENWEQELLESQERWRKLQTQEHEATEARHSRDLDRRIQSLLSANEKMRRKYERGEFLKSERDDQKREQTFERWTQERLDKIAQLRHEYERAKGKRHRKFVESMNELEKRHQQELRERRAKNREEERKARENRERLNRSLAEQEEQRRREREEPCTSLTQSHCDLCDIWGPSFGDKTRAQIAGVEHKLALKLKHDISRDAKRAIQHTAEEEVKALAGLMLQWEINCVAEGRYDPVAQE